MATGRTQFYRVRSRCGDGTWLWVDTTLHGFLDDPANPHVLAECIDVSAEMAVQDALEDREELLRRLIEEMPDGLLQLDKEQSVVFHNARLREILRSPGSVADETPGGVSFDAGGSGDGLEGLLGSLTADSQRQFHETVSLVMAHGESSDLEAEIVDPTGEPCYALFKIRPLLRHRDATGVIASVLDVSDSARMRRDLERRANHDPLTGVRNRASIVFSIATELAASVDTAILYIDLDEFKSINDTFGHAAGDEVLVEVADRLKRAVRPSDEVGRMGGDEFLVLLREVADEPVAMVAARRISNAMRGPCELSFGSIQLCASVGVARPARRGADAERLIEQADAAMYHSKQQRGGTPVSADATVPPLQDAHTAVSAKHS